MRRRLIRLNEEIENECYAGKECIDTVMDMTEKKVFDLLSTRGGGGDYVPIRQVVMNALRKLKSSKDFRNGNRYSNRISSIWTIGLPVTAFRPDF